MHGSLQSLGADYEIVISHYSEDLSWLEPHAEHCHIYHKGSETQPRFKYRQWEKIPNVGRESHTYLYHIITNYDHLADITVFLQGSLSDHGMFCWTRRTNCFVATGVAFNKVEWGRLNHVGKWKNELQTGIMQRSNMTVGQFWSSIFYSPHPAYKNQSLAGCFSVPRDQILKRPKAFYEKVIDFVDDHPNPETGHYLERLWYSIFTL